MCKKLQTTIAGCNQIWCSTSVSLCNHIEEWKWIAFLSAWRVVCLLTLGSASPKSEYKKRCDKRKSGCAVMQATRENCECLGYMFFHDILVPLYTHYWFKTSHFFFLDKTHTMETCSSSSHTSVMESGFELRFPSCLGVAFSIKLVHLWVI